MTMMMMMVGVVETMTMMVMMMGGGDGDYDYDGDDGEFFESEDYDYVVGGYTGGDYDYEGSLLPDDTGFPNDVELPVDGLDYAVQDFDVQDYAVQDYAVQDSGEEEREGVADWGDDEDLDYEDDVDFEEDVNEEEDGDDQEDQQEQTEEEEEISEGIADAVEEANTAQVVERLESSDNVEALAVGFTFSSEIREEALVKTEARVKDRDVITMKSIAEASLSSKEYNKLARVFVLPVYPKGNQTLVDELEKLFRDTELMQRIASADPRKDFLPEGGRRRLQCDGCTPVNSYVCAHCWTSVVCSKFYWCPTVNSTQSSPKG